MKFSRITLFSFFLMSLFLVSCRDKVILEYHFDADFNINRYRYFRLVKLNLVDELAPPPLAAVVTNKRGKPLKKALNWVDNKYYQKVKRRIYKRLNNGIDSWLKPLVRQPSDSRYQKRLLYLGIGVKQYYSFNDGGTNNGLPVSA